MPAPAPAIDPGFLLGIHQPAWLRTVEVPVFVSHTRLRRYKTLPKRLKGARFAVDSGAFSEIAKYGRFITEPGEYADALLRYREEIGGLMWASPQDFMCEPHMLAKTGLDVREHQRRSIASVELLRTLAPGVHVIPVLQGNDVNSYLECARGFAAAGIDLAAEPLVGLGSVCRRQSTREIVEIVGTLTAELGCRLHGFGLKIKGLEQLVRAGEAQCYSADSMSWSYAGRRVAGCSHGRPVKSESNCLSYALEWRERLLARIPAQSPAPVAPHATLALAT